MRKSLFFILLATAAVPALAAPDPDGRNDGRRSQNVERSERGNGERARPQRAERASRAAASEQAAPVAPVQRTQRNQQQDVARIQRAQRNQQSYGATVDRRQRALRDGNQINQNVSRYSGQGAREYSRRRQVTTDGSSRTSGQYSGQYSGDRSGTNWRDRTRTTQTTTSTNRLSNWNNDRDGRRWSSDWRRDNRYNWRNHRTRYSSLYRLGRYYDPYRYGYRRWSIGLTLGSGYYNNSNYWLNDPWQYRLPPAYGPYRWIRYYNDALLVNVYSGEVVDVIYGFFW
jgi:hypothetical protein